jgi:hypothetical protein
MTRRTGFSPETRACIIDRATDVNGVVRCEKCGGQYSGLQLHHRRPRQAGGSRRPETNLPSNCLVLDDMCHLWVESYRTLSYANGWLLKSGQFPADVPVLRRNVWVQLRDDGSVIPHTPSLRAVK